VSSVVVSEQVEPIVVEAAGNLTLRASASATQL
jgi:hypothetical protein